MSYPPSQGELVEKYLMDAMDKYPEKSKQEIFAIVADKGFPKASIRRIKGDLLKKLIEYARILK